MPKTAIALSPWRALGWPRWPVSTRRESPHGDCKPVAARLLTATRQLQSGPPAEQGGADLGAGELLEGVGGGAYAVEVVRQAQALVGRVDVVLREHHAEVDAGRVQCVAERALRPGAALPGEQGVDAPGSRHRTAGGLVAGVVERGEAGLDPVEPLHGDLGALGGVAGRL